MTDWPHCADDIRLGDVTLRTEDAEVTWELWACPTPPKYGADIFAVSEHGLLSGISGESFFDAPHPAKDFARMVWNVRKGRDA